MKIHKGAMFGLPIRDLLTYTNVAYLLSLLLTFLLTATLWRVSVAAQNESEREVSEYQADARVKIAQANAQAEEARQEAAKATLEAERIKATLQWRIIRPEDRKKLVSNLSAAEHKKAHLAWLLGDPESVWLGQQFATIFREAGWHTTGQAIPVVDSVATGISIPRDPSSLNDPLRGIFTLSGIAVGDYVLPHAPFAAGSNAASDEATLFIGIRPAAVVGVSFR